MSCDLDRARDSLFGFLDRQLLTVIDNDVFLARDATVEVIDVGYDVSTHGVTGAVHDRLMFTDAILLRELLEWPTGETRKTYEPGRGMAATTHGDEILRAAEGWCESWQTGYLQDDWWQDEYLSQTPDADEIWEVFGEAGLSTPYAWYDQVDGTLGELRTRLQ